MFTHVAAPKRRQTRRSAKQKDDIIAANHTSAGQAETK